MSRVARALVAGIVILAFGAVPLAADCCAISCAESTSRGAASSAMPDGMPGCHQSAQREIRVSQNSDPCGHHRPGVILAEAATPQRVLATSPDAAAVATSWAAADRQPGPRCTRPAAGTDPPVHSHARPVSLRI